MLTGGLPSNRSVPIFHRSQTKHIRAYDRALPQMPARRLSIMPASGPAALLYARKAFEVAPALNSAVAALSGYGSDDFGAPTCPQYPSRHDHAQAVGSHFFKL
jgi:hypothetical protein